MLTPEHADGRRQRRTIAHVEDDERRLRGGGLGEIGQLLDLAERDAQTTRLHQLFELPVPGSCERRGQCCYQRSPNQMRRHEPGPVVGEVRCTRCGHARILQEMAVPSEAAARESVDEEPDDVPDDHAGCAARAA